MMINAREWLSIPKEERLLCIQLTVAENISGKRKPRRG
jgi:hypothetical protein